MTVELGVGISYVPGLEPLLEPGLSCVDVIEIEPETFWNYKGNVSQPYVLPDYTLDHLRSIEQPKIIHSVGFGVGGTYRAPQDFVAALIKTISAFDAPWVSEHLSFTHVVSNQKTFHTGFMMPALQTAEGALTAADTIRDLIDKLPVPLAVETTVNYLRPRKGELSDGEFVALAVDRANCGILLDLHNIWTNEKNGRQKVDDFLATIPLDQVWEIHLGGGFEFEGYWLDAHSGAVPGPVMQVYEEIIPSLPNIKAVIYEIFPSFIPSFGIDAIRDQLEKIKAIYEHSKQNSVVTRPYQSSTEPIIADSKNQDISISPYLWETTLGELVTNGKEDGVLAKELERDESISLVRKMIWKFRAGSIVKNLTALVKLFFVHDKDSELESLLDGYFKLTKPEPFASEDAKGFINYLRQQNVDVPYLRDILLYEEASIKAAIDQKTQYVSFNYDPLELLLALTEGYVPKSLATGCYELEVQPVNELIS